MKKYYTPKRTFPLKAMVFRRNDAFVRSTLHRNILPAVGYVHFHFWDLESDNMHSLNINIGISFCDPNEYLEADSNHGKEMAKTIEYRPHNCISNDFKFVEDKEVFQPMEDYFNDEEILKHPYKGNFDTFFRLPLFTQRAIARHFEKVTMFLNFNMREENFSACKIRGKEVAYLFERTILDQIECYFNRAMQSYLHKRFKDDFEPTKSSEILLERRNHRIFGPMTPAPKIKNGCIILPIKSNIYFRDFKKYSRGNAPEIKRKNCVSIGFIAVKVENDDFYIGTSYCNPADASEYKPKFGKRLAYKRMMERYEKKEKNQMSCLDKRIILQKNLDIFYFNADNLTAVEYLHPNPLMMHFDYIRENLTEDFCTEKVRNKILEALSDWVKFPIFD